MAGETIWPVPPLRTPDTYHLPPIEGLLRYEAVQLLLERARSALPTFALVPENASAVVQICRRLDGIPLAIELAAARLRVLSVEQIAARLDDALRLLTAGSRTALPRQQTLRATMDWSYGLLSEGEQIVFRRLSIFAGSFSLDAADAICAGEGIDQSDLLALLSRLVDKSLLLVVGRRGEARYQVLETLRQYGHVKLQEAGEADLLRVRHRDWCVALAERTGPMLLGEQQGVALSRLELEHDNLRAALRAAREHGDAETVARIGVALWHFWLFRGYLSEGRLVLEWAAEAYTERTPLRVWILQTGGALASYQDGARRVGRLNERRLEEAIGLAREFGDWGAVASALNALGAIRRARGEYEQAVASYEEALTVLRQLGDTQTMALVLAEWGLTLLALGENDGAVARCEESLALARVHASPLRIAGSLTTLAIAVLELNDAERARVLCEESLALRRKLGDKGGTAHSLAVLGSIALEQRQYPRALAHYRASLALRQETGEQEGIAVALAGLAAVAAAHGASHSAALLFGAAEALRAAIDVPLLPTDRFRLERAIATARSHAGSATFDEAWKEGQAMPMEAAIAAAQELALPAGAPAVSTAEIGPSVVSRPAPSLRNAFGLTAREIEVLRLLALGLTNLQIAEQLTISPRTTDAHLRSIYSKLGVTSRSAATRTAIEHQLA
ncbi:MAG: tetratricopeptide repeat protein [Gammaproteobacteria bacterium]|nr:tetratricopeptide repeat protein [Gammaproteobacteria bacterium]